MNSGLAFLTVAASILAGAMAAFGFASWLEAASFVTGAVCVWLTVRESVWNFPIGLANVTTYCVVFLEARLFADASLQVVYFVLGAMGWWMWLYGGARGTQLAIGHARSSELIITGAAAFLG